VTPRSWDQTCDHPDQIVIHVARKPERVRTRTHYGRDELVCLFKTLLFDLEPVGCDTGESCIVEDNDCIRMLRQTSKGEEGIIRLNHYIRIYSDIRTMIVEQAERSLTPFRIVWKHAIGLHQLFWIPITQSFEHMTS
jgi:hypothetical protein